MLLTVIPCLNEAAHLKPLVEYLIAESRAVPMRIVIADGGSTDGSFAIAQQLAEEYEAVRVLSNPKRIQSAAINVAVASEAAEAEYLLRIDAHARYPRGFVVALMADAVATQADAVVVAMVTIGTRGFQRAVAAAQNSKLGNGGAAHRLNAGAGEGQWVDHGHHALMRMAAFRAVGGYDETFTHNEDAELDARLRAAGYRIWLTSRTQMEYFPRSAPWPLFRQYRGYGRGRLRNLLKHRARPKLRQLLPVAVAPAWALALLSPLSGVLALPLLLWSALCLGYGTLLALRAKDRTVLLSGPAAMLMHSGWSLGFWQGVVEHYQRRSAA